MRRLIIGGGWFNQAPGARIAFRTWGEPSDRSYDLGLRLVRNR